MGWAGTNDESINWGAVHGVVLSNFYFRSISHLSFNYSWGHTVGVGGHVTDRCCSSSNDNVPPSWFLKMCGIDSQTDWRILNEYHSSDLGFCIWPCGAGRLIKVCTNHSGWITLNHRPTRCWSSDLGKAFVFLSSDIKRKGGHSKWDTFSFSPYLSLNKIMKK